MEDLKASEITQSTQGTLDESFDSNSDNSSIEKVPDKLSTQGASSSNVKPIISYEFMVWAVYLPLTVLAIADRFAWNVWPRQTFTIGAGSAGSDRMEGFKPGPWSVVTYDVLARISGRFSIICLNLLMMTRMRSLEHFLAFSWVGKYVLNCTDIVNANLRLHKWNAIALCVLTLIHVWSILFPCVTHGYSAQVVPGHFEWPISERTPKGFKDADPETKTMSLQADDVFRLVEMTILLGILVPLSVHWLARRWHLGIQVHRFINVVYFVDIVRRHSHPHSWVLNTPVFILWLFDKVWTLWFHFCKSPEVHRVRISKDYMVLYWKHPYGGDTQTVGPDYRLRLNDASIFEGSHVFTSFENRTGLQLNDTDFPWSVGCMIRVFRNKRVPQIGRKEPHSHTLRMYDTEKLDLTAWGPVKGEMSDSVLESLLKSESGRPVALIGTGSGINYLIDALQWIHKHGLTTSKVTLLHSTRDKGLHEWAKKAAGTLIPVGANIEAVFALTGSALSGDKPVNISLTKTNDTSSTNSSEEEEIIGDNTVGNYMDSVEEDVKVDIVFGRIDFHKMIPKYAVVFCQGGLALKNAVASVCRKKKTRFFAGIGGGGS